MNRSYIYTFVVFIYLSVTLAVTAQGQRKDDPKRVRAYRVEEPPTLDGESALTTCDTCS